MSGAICPLPGCGRTFATSAELQTHLKAGHKAGTPSLTEQTLPTPPNQLSRNMSSGVSAPASALIKPPSKKAARGFSQQVASTSTQDTPLASISQNAPQSIAEELRSLAQLHVQGLLTDAEFAAAKARALSTVPASTPAAALAPAPVPVTKTPARSTSYRTTAAIQRAAALQSPSPSGSPAQAAGAAALARSRLTTIDLTGDLPQLDRASSAPAPSSQRSSANALVEAMHAIQQAYSAPTSMLSAPSSSGLLPLSSSSSMSPVRAPSRKRSRAGASADTTSAITGEVRGARFKSKPTNADKERIARALHQRLYLVTRHPINHETLTAEFVVLGSVGNVYDVRISQVLRVSATSHTIYQKALIPSELREIFAAAPRDPTRTVIASALVRNRYAELTGDQSANSLRGGASAGAAAGEVPRRPVEGDCPVCYEPLKERDDLVWCRTSCGQSLHRDCYVNWRTSQGKGTCVFCRADWIQDGAAAAAAARGGDGYMNLAALQPGMPTEREYEGDYHHWRRNY